MRSWHGNVFGRNWRAPPEPALCGNSTCYAPLVAFFVEEQTSYYQQVEGFVRPSFRRSSNYCTKQQAENGRDRALIQYLNGQGVLMTPWRFYFGCYIDTLCGRTLRNRMSGAAARHFFFLEKVRTVSACIGINLPLKKRPADGGEQPTPPWAALAQASRKCTFAQLAEDTPVPNAACWRKNLRLYAAGRRKMWMRTRKNTICTSY